MSISSVIRRVGELPLGHFARLAGLPTTKADDDMIRLRFVHFLEAAREEDEGMFADWYQAWTAFCADGKQPSRVPAAVIPSDNAIAPSFPSFVR